MTQPGSLSCLAAAACLGACASDSELPLAPPEPTILLTVERECGSCHTPSHADAMAEAIAIFDLEDPDWLSGAIAVDLARRRAGE